MGSKPNYYRCNVVRYDGMLRFQVPSRRKGVLPYLVELDAYDFNGRCVCKDFTIHCEPILRRGITPLGAVDGGLREAPVWGTVEDSLRCYHIYVARMKFADDVMRAISAERKENSRTNEKHASTKDSD